MIADGRHLLVWRHADAGPPIWDPAEDFERALTAQGLKDALRTANWLRKQLPSRFTLLASPAPRAWQTACQLGEAQVFKPLSPDRSVHELLPELARYWPNDSRPVVVVGHLPTLGDLIQSLVDTPDSGLLVIEKSSVFCVQQDDDAIELVPDLAFAINWSAPIIRL